jgi:mRNA interferase MazF
MGIPAKGSVVLVPFPFSDLSESDFSEGGLRTTSYVRPGKIFTANQGIFVSVAGNLNHEARATVAEAIIALIQFP